MARLALLLAQVVYAIATWWKSKRNAERTAAVRADPGAAWVSKFGGADKRESQSGADDAGRAGDK